MNCRVGWSLEFLYTVLPKTFVNTEYKKERKQAVLERQLSLLPQDQEEAELERDLERIPRSNIPSNIGRAVKSVVEYYGYADVTLDNVINDARIRGILTQHINLERRRIIKEKLDAKDLSRKLNIACPRDECKGFLDANYECKLCGTKVCRRCLVEIANSIEGVSKEDEHECDEAIVKNVEEVVKSSKNCPGCGAPIYKIEGCNQMFCTSCYTAFLWSTLEIKSTSQIHNPHMPAELETRGPPLQDNPYGIGALSHKVPERYAELYKVMGICNRLMPQYNLNLDNEFKKQRKKYLKGGLKTKNDFANALINVEMKQQKYQSICQEIIILRDQVLDVLRDDNDNKIERIDKILNNYRQRLETLSNLYGISVKKLYV